MAEPLSPPRPLFTPHVPEFEPITRARIDVHFQGRRGRVQPLWAGVGYDELNWTYTSTGRALLAEIGAFSPTPYFIRPHYIFISGTGLSLPHWGSGNVYHEDADGKPSYDFTIADEVYDTIVGAGHRPLVELGFTPLPLVDEELLATFPYEASPTQYGPYENGAWAFPPKDYGKWAGLVEALVAHCVERYGADEVRKWRWELWNEPDIFYWKGTPKQFCELYEATATAVRDVLPDAQVGGPATTGDPCGPPFLKEFLSFCAERRLPLDFVSFHTKGAYFSPWRTYGPIGASAPDKQSPSSLKMLREVREHLELIAGFPEFADVPAVIDECDASVPAHWGRYDNANFSYRNTEYFPAFQAKLMKKLLDLNAEQTAQVGLAMTWSFYIEGERYFEGTRSLLTAGSIEKPVLNAYRMFGRLGTERLDASSDQAFPLAGLDDPAAGMPEEIDVLGTVDGNDRVAILVWRHGDDQYQTAPGADVTLVLDELPTASGRARLTHWRIDGEHSNSYARWMEAGEPQRPTAEQLATIKARQGLEAIEPAQEVTWQDGRLQLEFTLPLPAVSLIEVDLSGADR